MIQEVPLHDAENATLPLDIVAVTRRAAVSQRWYWLAPLLAMILFVGVMVTLFWALRRDEIDRQQQGLYRDVEWAQQVMRLRMQNNQDELIALAREAAQGDLDAARFRTLARQFMASSPEVIEIGRIDADHTDHWIVTSDALFDDGIPDSKQRLAGPESRATFDAAENTREPAYSGPFAGPDNDYLLEMHIPVFVGGHFTGTLSAVYSVVNISRYVVPHESSQKYSISIVDDKGAPLVGRLPPLGGDSELNYELPFDPPGHGIYLHVTSHRIRSNLTDNFLVWAVAALSVFIIWSLWILMRHNKRRLEAEAVRDRLFNLSLDILCILDAKGELLRINPACQHVLGREPSSLEGCSLLDLVHPDDRAATADELHKAGMGQPMISFENRCRRIIADGTTEYRWLVWTLNPDLQAKPGKRLLYAVAHDVTLRRARQQALVAETAFRRAMEDSLLTGMRVIDLEGRITYVNPAFCRMLGFAETELLGATPPYPYWPRERYPQNHVTLNQILTGRAPAAGLEVNVMRKDGSYFDARMYVSPLLNEHGLQTGWMTSMTDITEPKRIRQELAQAQERFTTVLEELDAAVSVYGGYADHDQLLFANRYYRRLFGTDAFGHRELSATHPAAFGPERDATTNEVHSGTTSKWFEVRQRTIQWVDGRKVQMQVATDITARKRTEEMVRQQQEKVQLTSRLITMGEMASSLAHELNQPLTAIANYSMGTVARVRSTIERGDRTDPQELLIALQKTSAQAERAGKIIRRIREFVKRSEPHRRVINLRTVVDDAVGFAEIEAAKKRILIRTEIPEAIAEIQADPIMIEQVLLNLLKNAIDAMQDAIVREVVVQVVDRVGHVEFAVVDHGSGIAPDVDERLFEPFYSTKDEGMGMGLNICRSIVEFHHGRLWVQNNVGGGCTFHFTLPKAAVASAILA
ncbi:MAG: PAS domain S-box protein [Burkholderiaceae bacterium]|jgi:PAS domain S-box-containing protein